MFSNLKQTLEQAASAASSLAVSSSGERNDFVNRFAGLIESEAETLVRENAADVTKASGGSDSESSKDPLAKAPLSKAMVDRLTLTPSRLKGLADGLRDTALLPDPLGRVEDQCTLNSGLEVGRLRVPLGLIVFICEARPGAVAEAAAMAVKSGNAIVIKPGRESASSSRAIGALISRSLKESGLPPQAVTVLADLPREEIKTLVSFDDLVDLVIPRGGEGLVRFVADNSRIPVLKHFKGVNHLFIDSQAPLQMALELTVNGKCNRPGTCNALECLLVARDEAPHFLPAAAKALLEQGVEIAACPKALPLMPGAREANDDDFGREFLDLILAVKVVENLNEALDHIRRYGSKHTEAICTNNLQNALRFQKLVDASCVLVNASTRLNDGGCLGLGAEMGISTTKLHAYGPMGLKELTTTKFIVTGNGQLRS